MIIPRTAGQCGKADYGWLKARYAFSFGHYFDPNLMGYSVLRALNQEVLAPGASLQPRTFPRVDILNLVLDGDATYRDSEGRHTQAGAGEALLLTTRPGVSYSEYNCNAGAPLTRLQLWLDASAGREAPSIQKCPLTAHGCQLLASPDGNPNCLMLRQQVWIYHLAFTQGETLDIALHGPRAWLQSIHGTSRVSAGENSAREVLTCGDGAFIHDESLLTLTAETAFQGLLIDLPS